MTNTPTNQYRRPLAAVIMAAGQGKRMKDPARAKVLYELDGKPMIRYVVDLALSWGPVRSWSSWDINASW